MAPKAIIVADDLTGALDSAVAFAGRGLSVVAVRNPALLEDALRLDADVLAVSTHSREGGAAAAKRAVEAVASLLGGYRGILFKKVDSRLKGHVGIEAGALAALRGRARALVCPAVPRLGRRVEAGMVAGSGIDEPIPVARVQGALDAEIVDAVRDADLDRALGSMSRDEMAERLFVGAAGLAEALARRVAPVVEKPDIALGVPALLAVGSRDPVTVAQVAALVKARPDIACLDAPDGVLPDREAVGAAVSLVRMVVGPSEIPAAEAAAAFAESVAMLAGRLAPKTLFVSGGECADAVLQRLGFDMLAVKGEAMPGMQVSIPLGLGGPEIVTKSGGFGDPRALVALCAKLGQPAGRRRVRASRSA